MPAQQTAAFKKAVEDSRKLKAKPSDNELLEVPSIPHQHPQNHQQAIL